MKKRVVSTQTPFAQSLSVPDFLEKNRIFSEYLEDLLDIVGYQMVFTGKVIESEEIEGKITKVALAQKVVGNSKEEVKELEKQLLTSVKIPTLGDFLHYSFEHGDMGSYVSFLKAEHPQTKEPIAIIMVWANWLKEDGEKGYLKVHWTWFASMYEEGTKEIDSYPALGLVTVS